jgi:hypothetical protein
MLLVSLLIFHPCSPVDIHDVPIVPVDGVIPDINGAPAIYTVKKVSRFPIPGCDVT